MKAETASLELVLEVAAFLERADLDGVRGAKSIGVSGRLLGWAGFISADIPYELRSANSLDEPTQFAFMLLPFGSALQAPPLPRQST